MKSFSKLAYPYIAWIGVFIVVPMLLIFLYAFTKAGNGVLTLQFTLDNFFRFFSDNVFANVLWRSMKLAFVTTLICIALGYPAAYFMAQLGERSKGLMVLLITLPQWINMLVRTYAWRGILLNVPISAEMKVLIGMVYNFIPFMILQIYTSLSKMDKSLLQAASDLGADGVQSFLRVTLPLSIPGVVSGITLVFLPTVSSFFIPNLLGGGDYVLIGNLIENYFVSTGDWNFGSAISLIMAVIIMVSMYLTKKIDRDVEEQK